MTFNRDVFDSTINGRPGTVLKTINRISHAFVIHHLFHSIYRLKINSTHWFKTSFPFQSGDLCWWNTELPITRSMGIVARPDYILITPIDRCHSWLHHFEPKQLCHLVASFWPHLTKPKRLSRLLSSPCPNPNRCPTWFQIKWNCSLLLLLLKKVGSARLRESGMHPISPKIPAPQYQPIDRKKRKEKKSRRL